MNVEIWTTSNPLAFIAVVVGTTPPAAAIRVWKRIELQRGKPRICLNPDAVIPTLERVGWMLLP